MIIINHLSKRFKKLNALNNINVEMHRGQAIALLGPNGSGKTTLIKCILGLVKPQSGEIFVDSKLVSGDVLYRENIGVRYKFKIDAVAVALYFVVVYPHAITFPQMNAIAGSLFCLSHANDNIVPDDAIP